MEERGISYSGQGRGTFVAPAIVRGTTRYIDSFSQDTDNRGGIPGQRILSIDTVAATMALAGLLNVESGAPLIRVKRIRLIDDAPVGLHDAYFVLPRGAKISQSQIEKSGSLYKLLNEKFGFAPAEAVENLCSGACDTEDARLLNIAPGDPLLICERITLSERREPMEYCLMKYVSSYRYRTRVTRHSDGRV